MITETAKTEYLVTRASPTSHEIQHLGGQKVSWGSRVVFLSVLELRRQIFETEREREETN